MPKSEQVDTMTVACRLVGCKESEIEVAKWVSAEDFLVMRKDGRKDHFTFEQFKEAERPRGATAAKPQAAEAAPQRSMSGAPERIAPSKR